MILESISFLDPADLEIIEQAAASTGKPEREDELALGVECAWPRGEFQL
jgi:hypothetical protein